MTRDEIIDMMDWHPSIARDGSGGLLARVERIVRAAEEAERVACVQEIRKVRECIWDGSDEVIKETARNVCDNLIIRISARGLA